LKATPEVAPEVGPGVALQSGWTRAERVATFAPIMALCAVPLDIRSPAGTVLFADMVTLTPGTTSLDVSADGRTLYVHVLDAPNREAAIAGMKSTLEARAREVLP
jgi:multisubunit Na+/H+ antiporter MnhE subunit